MKNVLIIGLIGGLLYLGSKALSAKKLSDKSIVRTRNPRIAKINLSGIRLATDLFIDNPTNNSIQITKPVITFTSGGKYIASSIPSKEQFTISAMNQTSLGTIEVEIPWSALTPFISNLLTRIPGLVQSGNATITSLNMPFEYHYSLYINGLFYESQPEILA